MAYTTIPGTNSRYGTPEDAQRALNDPSHRLAPVYATRPDGTLDMSRVVGYSGPGRDTSIHSKISRAMPYVVGGGFAYGQLAPLFAGAAGGGGATGATTSMIPGTGIPVVAGVGPAVTAPPSVAAGLGTVAARTAVPTATQSIGQRIANAMTSREGIASLATILPMLMARGGGGTRSALGNAADTSSQLNELIGMQTERARRTDPLHQMVTRLAEARMPTSSRG